MKKKICFIVAAPITARAFLINHITALSQHYNVYLIANFQKGDEQLMDDLPLTSYFNVPIARNIKIASDSSVLLKLKKICKNERFDAVHSVTPKAGLLAMIASNLAGVPHRIHIFTGQVWYTKKGLFKWLLKFLDKVIVWNATNILVDGNSQREFLIENSIVSEKRSSVLGSGSISGVDIQKFAPNESLRSSFRKKLGYSDENVVYIFLGRFNKDKGVLDLAHAFKKLTEKAPMARLLVVGFDEANMTKPVAEIISDDTKVSILGSTAKPEDYLRAADVFCLPSYREGFGTSVIEASAVGLPVICSDTYGLKGTVVENETGLIHVKGDVQSLYSKMLMLYKDTSFRLKLGSNGIGFVENNFTMTTITQEWLKFYNNILAK